MTAPGAGEGDEFGLLRENAEEVGLPWSGPPEVRRIGHDGLSALRWGDGPPRLVLLHGGAQNAHTWDTVLLALGVPALAVDLPGHGHSAWRPDRDYSPRTNAASLTPFLRAEAPEADAVVGMSLGGLTTIALTAAAPDLVRRAVIVDVTPASGSRVAAMTTAQQGTVALARSGPAEFDTREEMIDAAVAAAPHRAPSSLRRGVVHNTRRTAGGRWAWRYDRRAGPAPDFSALWADLAAAEGPLTLVRGGDSVFVTDADAEELVRRRPGAQVHVVPGAGHSVQSDQPLELTAIIRAAAGLS
jgi:pimeloyl-ACP methyl ester carboxylesterase